MEALNPDIESTLLQLLQNQESLKEYQLMGLLVENGYEQFKPCLDELKLFQSHFLLFHLLYHLQDKWLNDQVGWLEIHALNIQLHPYCEQSLPQNKDPLREYYLNLEELKKTTQQEVRHLLDTFWQKFEHYLPEEQLTSDLQTLELAIEDFKLENVTLKTRQLLQQHHPDKGGQAEEFQKIREASNRLKHHLKLK